MDWPCRSRTERKSRSSITRRRAKFEVCLIPTVTTSSSLPTSELAPSISCASGAPRRLRQIRGQAWLSPEVRALWELDERALGALVPAVSRGGRGVDQSADTTKTNFVLQDLPAR